MLPRLRAAGWHLLISATVASLAASLVFGLWYPGAYRLLSGGRDLFVLLTAVDIVLGPLLTFAVFNTAKGWSQLRRDLAVIALIQTMALGYGLHAVFVVRPVAMVLEGSRFRVVSAKDVAVNELHEARPEYRELPWSGPWLLGTRAATSAKEQSDALFMATHGTDVGQRPMFWQPYADCVALALNRSRPLDKLLAHYPQREAELRSMLPSMGVSGASARFIPVIARTLDWTAVLDAAGQPVGFLPVNGFF